MKKALAFVAKFLLFLGLDVTGGVFYHPFHIESTLQTNSLAPRSFVWDGVVMMLAVWLVFLLIEAFRKRFVTSAPWTTLALALAAFTGFLLKLGFVTHNW